jgi:hypothetical protein
MTTFLETVRTRRQAVPRPRSISWRSVGEMVQISVEVINESSERTAPDTLVIEAAAFGAFVPNVPIARIAVGGLDPGEDREVTTAVSRTALDEITGRGAPGTRRNRLASLENLHGACWIGNLNIYFEKAPADAVERHCAFGLKVPAGKVILASFIVGESACTYRTRCSDAAWSAEVLARHTALLFVQAPRDPGKRADVAVDVTRTLDGKVVTVEFEFQTVSGSGDRLGCITV